MVYLLIGHLKGSDSTLSTQTRTHISQKKKRFRQFQQAAHSAGTLCLSGVVYVPHVSSLISLSPSTPSIPENPHCTWLLPTADKTADRWQTTPLSFTPTPTGDSGGSSISSPRGHGLKRQSGRETARRGREKGRREQVAQTVASNISGPELLRGIFRTSLLHVPAPPLVSTNYASSLYLDGGRS